MAYPVVPVIRSSLLNGQSNGRLEARILSETPGQAGGPGVLLIHPAARAWRALCAAALSNGHVLKASGPQSSFRTYAEQERIFRERYRTAYKANTDVKVWNGVRWYRWYGATAAVPGTSNHGWAMAVDTGEERDGDLGTESIDTGTLAWLVANERTFGWSHELQSEPWHIRYYAGDAIPAAVLAFENAAPPAPPQEDDEMAQIIWFKGPDQKPHAYRVAGVTGKHLTWESLLQSRSDKDPEPTGNQLGSSDLPLGTNYQGKYALVDGPCKNVG